MSNEQHQPNSIVITGCSSGIGYSTAKALVDRGYRVFANVRTGDAAKRIQDELGDRVIPLIFDVRDNNRIGESVKFVRDTLAGNGLAGLINNAGIAIGGPLEIQPIDIIKEHFEINIFGLLSVTQAFLPLLGMNPHRPGRILNVSSIAGKIAAPFTGAYNGTKYALEGISDTMRRELSVYGIKVITIAPALINTPIWSKGLESERYKGTRYYESILRYIRVIERDKKRMLDADKVGARIAEIFTMKDPKVRYSISRMKVRDWVVTNIVPDRLFDKLITKHYGLQSRS